MAASRSRVLPKLIVFDLDYTLWPLHVDCSITPPLKKTNSGKIVDRYGDTAEPYAASEPLLKRLKSEGYLVAAASRTDAPPVARQFLSLLGWNQYFDYQEIYPGCKTTHFSRFKKDSGVAYEDMMFFDDEHRNIRDISKLGVTCVLVDSKGMREELFKKGLDMWKKSRVAAPDVHTKALQTFISNSFKSNAQLDPFIISEYLIPVPLFRNIVVKNLEFIGLKDLKVSHVTVSNHPKGKLINGTITLPNGAFTVDVDVESKPAILVIDLAQHLDVSLKDISVQFCMLQTAKSAKFLNVKVKDIKKIKLNELQSAIAGEYTAEIQFALDNIKPLIQCATEFLVPPVLNQFAVPRFNFAKLKI